MSPESGASAGVAGGVAAGVAAGIPLDRRSAPYTGWTRAHWEAMADQLMLAVRPHASPSHALVHLPGLASRSSRWSDALEGFARPFLTAAFRLAGAGGDDPHGHADWFARGIAAGVDPDSPERWPRLGERRQAHVEAASIAIGLHETRAWIWDRFGERTRVQVVDWLSGILGGPGYPNNWMWFQNVVEAFLRSVGAPWRPDDVERNLAAHESWYVGDGWFTDGGRRNFDYYVGWAMHFYPVWYSRMLGADADPGFVATTGQRLRRYLEDARLLVGSDGAPLFQGRSLIYRFAMLAPFWAGAHAGVTPLTPGGTRRLASGVLAHFAGHGALDPDGLLSIGWHGPFAAMRQRYSGPGSPYWASKGFAGLVLPADHPVWTAREEPLPVEESDVHHVIAPTGWLVSGTTADGIVRVLNHGADHAAGDDTALDNPFYARHAYSTHTTPALSQGDTQQPLDSTVALLDAGGRASHRTPLHRLDVGPDALGSRSRAHWPDASERGGNSEGAETIRVGPWLTTAAAIRGALEVRLARVDPVPESFGWPGDAASDDPDAYRPLDPGPWRLRVGGWSVVTDGSGDGSRGAAIGPGVRVAVHGRGLVSSVGDLGGFDQAGTTTASGTSPLGPVSATPWLATSEPVEPATVYAAVVVLTGVPAVADEARRVRVVVTGEQVTVSWPDGATTDLRLPWPAAIGAETGAARGDTR